MTALKAVVFDMDDTLLSINLNAFIGMFALDEANLLAQAARKSTVALFTSVGSAMLELNNGERAEGDIRTNQRFFADEVERRCGVPLLDPAIPDMPEIYEREILPHKNDRLTAARPREDAHETDAEPPTPRQSFFDALRVAVLHIFDQPVRREQKGQHFHAVQQRVQ